MSTAPSEVLMAPKAKLKAKAAPVDTFAETVSDIENLTREEAFQRVSDFLNTVDFQYFQLGGVLAVIQDNKWWEGEGYESFRAFIEGHFGLPYRKAMYLIEIYTTLVDSGVAWEDVSSVGWSKLKDMASILTPENVAEWVAKALSLTRLQLQEEVAKAKAGTLPTSGLGEDGDTGVSKVTSITFKVHPDQKETIKLAVEKAKGEAATDYDAVAIESICLNYLSGAKIQKPKALSEVLSCYSPQEVLEAFNSLWPDIAVTLA